MRNKKIFNDEYYKRLDYLRELYCEEDEILKDIRKQSAFEGFPITINQEEGKLLSILIALTDVKNILEIGTLFGYSTIWLARAMGEGGKITTIERDLYDCKIAKNNFLRAGLEEKIKIICGDAVKELEKLVGNFYDFIFIDADKINYLNYLNYAEKLLKKGGLIVADNTFLSGAVCLDYLPERIRFSTQNTIKKFNSLLADKTRYKTIMLNSEEGLTIALKLF